MTWELTEDERRDLLRLLESTLLRDRSHASYVRGGSKETLLAHCARLEAAVVLLSTREQEAREHARHTLAAAASAGAAPDGAK